MKVFLRSLFLFVILFIAITAVLVGTSSWYMNRTPFRIEEYKNILVLGDSHTECAIDDNFFKRSANYSKSAMPYLFSYGALKKLLADNPHIDTVLLSFHYASLLYAREQQWLFDESLIFTRIPVYLPYLDPSDLKLYAFNGEFYKAMLETPRSSYNYYMHKKEGRDLNWRRDRIGQFYPLPDFKLQEDIKTRKPYETLNKKEKLSLIQLKYIRKIAQLCKARGVTLVLINTPVYDWKKYTNYTEFEKNRKKYLGDQLFLNYASFTSRDSNYADISHLNKYGAREFSIYLDTSMSKDVKRAAAMLRAGQHMVSQ
jgi:hypothetical protein